MSNRASGLAPKIALALLPFLLLFGVWTWKQAGGEGEPPQAAQPSQSESATIDAEQTTSPANTTTAVDEGEARAVAEKVLQLYLSNPSSRVGEGLAELKPLVIPPLYTKIAGEWEGAQSHAEPRIEEIRGSALTPLQDGLGIRYNAEVVQLIDFPASDDQIVTYAVSIRLKQIDGKWIVYNLTVL